MIRVLNIAAIVMALLIAVAVQRAKSDIHDRRDHLASLAEEIRAEREAIRVLQAEWALLSSPDLLQERSAKYLALMPVRAGQIVGSAEAIPMRRRGEDAVEDTGILLRSSFRPGGVSATDNEKEEGR